MTRPLTVIESPYAGEIERNLAYLDLCILDSIARGETPVASHKMYTTALDDMIPAQRKLGIELGWEFRTHADRFAFYTDHGLSNGMSLTREKYVTDGIKFEERKVDLWMIEKMLSGDAIRLDVLIRRAKVGAWK